MPKLDDRKKEYDVLSLDTTANEVEVKKAFTRLALKYHPDLYSTNKSIGLDNHSSNRSKYQEVCKAYKKIMADDGCNISDWSSDKSDEIFFSLLGELLQNSTRNHELYTLLSPQVNSRPQFQNDNEYRCKEDAIEDDDEDSELNKLVDILKNRLQNGKSVPAGLTQEKLTRLKDDFMKQKEENKRMEQENHNTPTKKAKPTVAVPVAKPKPKNKKQLQAEQRRREREMANIAKELEEKKKKDEEKEQVRKQQDMERKRALEEEARKNDEDKKKQLNESRKKKERDEKEKEQRSQKEKEKNERLKKSQEEEQRKKEEEKRRKAEEKAAKLKAMKENKERDDREKQQPAKTKPRSQQYQQYQQQQQKYPREVPPRFLRQQQMKQQVPRKEQDFSYNSDYNDSLYKEDTRWTAIVPDTPQTEHNVSEDWDLDIDDSSKLTSVNYVETSWGGLPASEDWDLDVNKQTRSSVDHSLHSTTTVPKHEQLPTAFEQPSVVKSLFGQSDPPLPSASNSSNYQKVTDVAWGASLTGSTWDINQSVNKQWDCATSSSNVSKSSKEDLQRNSQCGNSLEKTQLSYSNNLLTPVQNIPKLNGTISGGSVGGATNWNRAAKMNHLDSVKTGSPGITPWAGLDSFDAGSPSPDLSHNMSQPNCAYTGGAKPKAAASYHSFHSDASDKARQLSSRSVNKFDDLTLERTEKGVNVPSIDNKVDSNLKVTGWLQNTSEDWDDEEKESTDGDGWTTVSQRTKKLSTIPFTPGTPSKTDANNAWTNRALKQLLDMGFKRDRAEKALRDNNGIIESAVSDLLMKGDYTESNTSQPLEEKPSSSASNGGDNTMSVASSATPNSTTPQKLNRKQRRKLQQMQMAEQANKAATVVTASSSTSTVTSSKTSDSTAKSVTTPATSLQSTAKGDGLLPTPPASHRLIHNEKPSNAPIDKVISRPTPSKTDNAMPKPVQRSLMAQLPGSQPSNNLDVTHNSVPHPPVGTRPTPPTPIQPPAPIQPPSSSQSSQCSAVLKDKAEKMNGSTLQPPINPVLLAQIQLQKLGLEDASVPSVSYNAPVVTTVSSQAVTNTIIQRYLQQIAQAPPEVESTPSVSASMHLSELLQQASVPANSLSDGPMKSKLLQWTQTSSASNSEPTTPPDDVNKNLTQKIDPVSAKWGVVAAPRLSPTPAEFKPGVPWRSRDDPDEEKSDTYEFSNDDVQATKLGPTEPSPVTPAVQKPVPFKPALVQVNESADFPPVVHSEHEAVLHTGPEPVVRPPPGLMSSENKNRVDETNWLILKGINPAVDPASLRSMCIQYGTILHFRAIANNVYVRYETVQQAENAWRGLNGRVILNFPIVAEVSTEESCMKAMSVAISAPNDTITTLPLTNHVSQPQIPPGYQNVSSFGTLWPTPQPPTVPQPLFQQSFNTYGVQPTSLGMNGAFSHWTIPPMAQSVLPNTSQLWSAAAPQQPSNLYQTYPGWLTTKPDVPMQPNVFSPGMDRCLPSELFNMKEYSS